MYGCRLLDYLLSDFVAAVLMPWWGPPLSEWSSFGAEAKAFLSFFVSSSLRLLTSSCVCVVWVFGCLFLGDLLHELSEQLEAQAQGTLHCMHAFAAMQ